jgi:hypothetical protein
MLYICLHVYILPHNSEFLSVSCVINYLAKTLSQKHVTNKCRRITGRVRNIFWVQI